jgi:hypothetical protein
MKAPIGEHNSMGTYLQNLRFSTKFVNFTWLSLLDIRIDLKKIEFCYNDISFNI